MIIILSPTARSADYRVQITVEQTPTASSLRYAVRAVFSRDDVNNKITAPNGREFTYQFANQWVENLTFQQMTSLVFGNWTANTGTSTARFQFLPFDLDDVDSQTPIITSPLPGSEVPTSFTLHWQSATDGFTNTLSRSNITSLRSQNPAGCCTAHYDMELIGPGNGSLQLEVFTRTALPDPMLISQTPPNLDTYTVDVNFISNSAPALFVVVPEPSTSLLAVVAVAGVFLVSPLHRFRRLATSGSRLDMPQQ